MENVIVLLINTFLEEMVYAELVEFQDVLLAHHLMRMFVLCVIPMKLNSLWMMMENVFVI